MNSYSVARAAISSCVLLGMVGCANAPKDIAASYVSPLAYESYDCDQLGQEAVRLSDRAASVFGEQKKKAKSDAVSTGIALILFWPAVFFIKGKGGASEPEVARLKGEMEAMEAVAIQKKCDIQFASLEASRIEPTLPPQDGDM